MRCTIPSVNSTVRLARALNDPYGSDGLKLYSTNRKGSYRSVRIERTEFAFSGSLQCGCIGHDWSYCNELDRVIARAKVRELKCITVIFECYTRTSANTVMASNECEIYA